MGVHHYKISLLPSVFFSEHLPKTLSDANVDHGQDPTTGWWATNPPTERLLAAVRTLLPKDIPGLMATLRSMYRVANSVRTFASVNHPQASKINFME